MNLRGVLKLAGALAAVATAAVVCIVAAAFAVYALAEAYLGPAGAAAVVAAIFALVAVVLAWLAGRRATPEKPAPADEAGLIDRLMLLAKDRPLIVLGATAAAVTVLMRNPAVITAIVSAFMAGSASKPPK